MLPTSARPLSSVVARIGLSALCAAVVMTPMACQGRRLGQAPTIPGAPGEAPIPINEQIVEVAREWRDAGRQDDAIRLLAMAIERNPTLTVVRVELGDLYSNVGDYSLAETQYAEAARVDPRNFDTQFKHGTVLQLLNRLSDSVRAYLRALAIRPDDFNANLNLATAYVQLNESTQAISYAEKATQVDPLNGVARANLAGIYSEVGRHEDAVKAYEAASELMPLSAKLLMNWADSLQHLQRYEEMANTLRAAIAISPSAAAYERLGFAEFKLRQYAGAEESFGKAVEADRSHYPALNGLAVCLLNKYLASERKDTEALSKAIELMRESLRMNKNQPRIVDLLSRYG